MARRSSRKPASAPVIDPAWREPVVLRPGEALVRFYRIGHGDCFLLAFPRAADSPAASGAADRPVFVLIDCGRKKGSEDELNADADDIVRSIHDATGGHIDVAVITHEHDDHLNAISEERFKDFKFGRLWLAWTENPKDRVADAVRAELDQQFALLTTAAALLPEGDRRRTSIESFVGFETGSGEPVDAAEARRLGAAGVQARLAETSTEQPKEGSNKHCMQVWAKRAGEIEYILPHTRPYDVPGTEGIRAFPLGPPRRETAEATLGTFQDEDSKGRPGEEFHFGAGGNFSMARFLGQAMPPNGDTDFPRPDIPFNPRLGVPLSDAATVPLIRDRYGNGIAGAGEPDAPEAWRRIDYAWLDAVESLALNMNTGTNNTSLALAFELGVGGKVLLFAADAQRGNWLSWNEGTWTDESQPPRVVDAKELLSRTVLYKVGHHGSHNGTLNGSLASRTVKRKGRGPKGEPVEYVNLGWLGTDRQAGEFTALITAMEDWANTKKRWPHPMPAIKKALLKKAEGRVLQTDTPLKEMEARFRLKHDYEPPANAMAEFRQRVTETPLYFDLRIALT